MTRDKLDTYKMAYLAGKNDVLEESKLVMCRLYGTMCKEISDMLSDGEISNEAYKKIMLTMDKVFGTEERELMCEEEKCNT